ncbi:MAG TPA: hypothetical protein VJV05_16165 [Pyrinomonadaceae bacterium]|nr:hypothetical protein [Pyrinomonadaceae bacterium]
MAIEIRGMAGVDCGAPSVAPFGMQQLYVKDPDNYKPCFQWPTQK